MGDEDKQEATMTISEVQELLDKQRKETHDNIVKFSATVACFTSKQVVAAFSKSASIAYETKLDKYF
jgi:hypothetical protein